MYEEGVVLHVIYISNLDMSQWCLLKMILHFFTSKFPTNSALALSAKLKGADKAGERSIKKAIPLTEI